MAFFLHWCGVDESMKGKKLVKVVCSTDLVLDSRLDEWFSLIAGNTALNSSEYNCKYCSFKCIMSRRNQLKTRIAVRITTTRSMIESLSLAFVAMDSLPYRANSLPSFYHWNSFVLQNCGCVYLI